MIFSDGKNAWGFTASEHRAARKSDWIVALSGALLIYLLVSLI